MIPHRFQITWTIGMVGRDNDRQAEHFSDLHQCTHAVYEVELILIGHTTTEPGLVVNQILVY